MKKYNGLSVATDSKGFRILCEMYPNKTKSEIEKRIVERLEEFAKRKGFEFDESHYTLSLKQIAESLDYNFTALILFIWGRWTKYLEAILEEVFIIGTGACKNCGCDSLEFWDHEGNDRILNCEHCGEKQIDRG